MDKQLKIGDWCLTREWGFAVVRSIYYCDRTQQMVANVAYASPLLTTGYANGMGDHGQGVERLADLEAEAPRGWRVKP